MYLEFNVSDLYDTGAVRSFLSLLVNKRIPIKKWPALSPVPDTMIEADSQPFGAKGQCKINMLIAGRANKLNIRVVERTTEDLVLGIDVIKNHKLCFDLTEAKDSQEHTHWNGNEEKEVPVQLSD